MRPINKSSNAKSKVYYAKPESAISEFDGLKGKSPNDRFILGWKPGDWKYYPKINEILPEFTPFPLVEGVNGYNPLSIEGSEANFKSRFSTIQNVRFLSTDMLLDLQGYEDDSYMCTTPTYNLIMGAGMVKKPYWHTRWEKPVMGSSVVEFDEEEYRRVIYHLLDNYPEIFEMPTVQDLEARRARYERRIQNHQRQNAVPNKLLMSRWQSDIEAIDRALAGPIVESEPVKTTKSRSRAKAV